MFSHIKELFTRPSGYSIAKSVRLRSSASAYFNRTPASASNRKTYTFSCWAKRGSLSSNQNIVAQGNNEVLFRFNTTDNINFADYTGGSAVWEITSSSVYRDPSAWYHIVFAIDTTQATSSNRVKVWINNSQVTFTGTYPTLNSDTPFNTTNAMLIGNRTGVSQYFDGYLTEINFIDGQALTPSSFGTTNATTGVWQPAKYTGTYGTNGFYLNFSDNSSNTATTIGKDYSGNGNNWTPNNISVTAGVTYDSMIDVPTLWGDGSTNRGNYATLNPLLGTGSTYNPQVPTNGNLNIGGGSSKVYSAATITMTSEKWYAEFSITLAASGYPIIGVWSSVPTGTDAYPGHINSTGVSYEANGSRDVNGTNTPSWAATFTTNDIIGVACDANTGKVWFSKNGTWLASGDPANGTTPAATLTSGTYIFGPCASASSGATLSANFGQRPFTYTPPTGFVALNTNNLPVPTIKNGAGYMAATLYAGSSSAQSITNTVNGVSFQPDLVWGKNRSNVNSHRLTDSVRGVGKVLFSNDTAGDTTGDGQLASFNSNGWTFTSGAGAGLNESGNNYVAWQWKANGSAVTNTAGSITSQVNAGATQGFSVVTGTFPASGTSCTFGHGLGVAPSMIISKGRDGGTSNWIVRHASLGNMTTKYLEMNGTGAVSTGGNAATAPSSTLASVSTDGLNNNMAFVAYCFSEVAGFSKFGSYTGNGSTDGPFVYLGFRPRFVMFKRTDAIASWRIIDTARESINATQNEIYPNLSNAQAGAANGMDILSNGFKLRGSYSEWNASGGTFMYACFAENPFKNALAR